MSLSPARFADAWLRGCAALLLLCCGSGAASAAAQTPQAPAAGATLTVRSKDCIDAVVADAKATLPIAEQGLAEARTAGDHNAESRFLRCVGYAHELLGDDREAYADYVAAVGAAETGGDRQALANALALRGEQLHANGDFDAAIADLKRASDLDRDLGDAEEENYVLNAMANLYADPNLGDYDKALGYYRDLLERHRRDGKRREMATAHFNIGATLDSQHRYADAIGEYRKALDLYRELGIADSVAETQRVIGATLVKQGEASAAIGWIDQALAWYRGANDADGVARTLLTRGIALRTAKRPDPALQDLDASRQFFLAAGNRRFLERIDEERALAYADLGRWRDAYAALRQQFDAQQVLDRTIADERMSRLRVQFDTERTQRQNQALQAENAARGAALQAATRERALQRWLIALAALLLALLSALVVRQLFKARRLRALAATDELTGVANRRGIMMFLDTQLAAARKSAQPLSVVAFDIDHFKHINDAHGHDAGDRALACVTALAGQAGRASDRLGRTGGEEFLLVLPAAGPDVAAEIAERMRRLVDTGSFDAVVPGLHVSVSLGVATRTESDRDADTLLKRADEALYRAKRGGRNRVEIESRQ
jgi:diguanylate cyclase (GGDEF)-like protein